MLFSVLRNCDAIASLLFDCIMDVLNVMPVVYMCICTYDRLSSFLTVLLLNTVASTSDIMLVIF